MKVINEIVFVEEGDLIHPFKSVHDWDVDQYYEFDYVFKKDVADACYNADKVIICIGQEMKVVHSDGDDEGKVMPRYGKEFNKACAGAWEDL